MFFFLGGLFIGSFLNVIIFRLERNEKGIFFGRSKCPHCRKTLQWFELIPLISFLLQKGRCRYCKKTISLQEPLVEFFTGLLFAILYWKFGLTLTTAYWLLITSLLIVLFVFDIRTQTIPDIVAYIGITLALVWLIFNFRFSLFNFLSAAALAGGFFALLVFISKETWMGSGDIKLGILSGLLVGFPAILLTLSLSFVLGAIVSLFLVGLKKKTLKSAVPFGPFLITAIFATIFYGGEIIRWYLRALL